MGNTVELLVTNLITFSELVVTFISVVISLKLSFQSN